MHEKRSADELRPLIDWEKVDAERALPVRAPRLPPELRHAQHVRSPNAACAVCQAKGRV